MVVWFTSTIYFTFALYVFAVYHVLESRSRFMSTGDSVANTKAAALSHGTPCVCVHCVRGGSFAYR